MPRGIPKKTDASGKPVRVTRADERRAKRPTFIDPNQFYSVDETAAAREKCRAALLAEIKAGKLKVTKDGKRTKILGAEIIRANREQAAA